VIALWANCGRFLENAKWRLTLKIPGNILDGRTGGRLVGEYKSQRADIMWAIRGRIDVTVFRCAIKSCAFW
jgi:hypothetical protein